MGASKFKARQQRKATPLIGLSLCSFDPAFVDIAASFGIDILWIELEHANLTMREAENLCRMISGNGMLSLIRLPNGDRDVVLKSAESGADMLMLPMVNDASDLTRFVQHARYSPARERGFHKLSRSMNFGIGDTVAELRRQANDNLLLWGQIETLAALENLDHLSQVREIDGLFVGPGDLSSAYGVPGNTSDVRVINAIAKCIATGHEHGRIVGSAAPPADVPRWMQHCIDMLMVGNNLGFYVSGIEGLRNQLDHAIQSAPSA